MVYARPVIKAVGVRKGDEFCEIMVSFGVFGKQDKVVLPLPFAACIAAGIHIHLAP